MTLKQVKPPSAAGPAQRGCWPGTPRFLDDLRRSAEPEVVLSSLARSSVPSFSDRCTVELSEGTGQAFRVSYPLSGDEPRAEVPAGSPDAIVVTPFEMPSCYGKPAFAGVIVHSWSLRAATPSDAVIARLLADGAIALVGRVRAESVSADADKRSARLAREAMTSRTIGEATGILMATQGVTSADATDMLRLAASRAGSDVYSTAVAVVAAGGLRPALPSTKPPPARPVPIASVHRLPDDG